MDLLSVRQLATMSPFEVVESSNEESKAVIVPRRKQSSTISMSHEQVGGVEDNLSAVQTDREIRNGGTKYARAARN